jgi:hypothetical protein
LNHFWGGPGIINDLDGGVPIVPIYKQFIKQDEYVIGWDFTYELKFQIASEAFQNSIPKYPEKKKELEKLTNSLDENDNPVLMFVKLKK